MDPLTAVSLASCVVQFTDFGVKLVSSSIKLYYSADGFDEERSQLRNFAEKVALSLVHCEDGKEASNDLRDLRELGETCQKIALELLSVLDGLKVKKPGGASRKWESFQKAVAAQTPWNKGKVALLERRLRSVREEMFQRIQAMMSEQQSQVLLILKELSDSKLLLLRDKILRTMEDVKKHNDAAVADLVSQLSSLAEASRDQKILCILNSLDFETRQSRQSDIAETEKRTFGWIFRDHHCPSNRQVGFRNWLESGNGIYWISGVPGSGKSVLMNYISNEPRTTKYLRSWAGDTNLIVARHFFWNAGAPMQKSQQGLLQSLLCEIYDQCPDLIPVTCPRWSRYTNIGATWSRQELTDSFKNLRRRRSLDFKFCFFVDGVDEYNGEDHAHIIDLLKELNASPSVKICLSSRPWNIFIAAFSTDSNRRLLLEDHNREDIRTYVKSRFEKDERFAILQSRDSRADHLLDQIVRKAQGVFLWVRIVANNLLRGLTNDDNMLDLQRRLDGVPTTLAAYFQHMFDNLDDFYREETAEILLMCLEGIQPLSLLNLWFHEQERVLPDNALHMEIKTLTQSDIVSIFEKFHKRVNARGQDLLVIEADIGSSGYPRYTVRFLHRTVKDFLSKPEMLEKLTSWMSHGFNARESLCKATIAMVKSLPLSKRVLFRLDVATSRPISNDPDTKSWRKCVSDFFTYAQLIEDGGGALDDALIDGLQRVIASFERPDNHDTDFEKVSGYILHHWAHEVNELDSSLVSPTSLSQICRYDPDMSSLFFMLAVDGKLKRYIQNNLIASPRIMERSFLQRPVLDRALRTPWVTWQTGMIEMHTNGAPLATRRQTRRIDIPMIRLLLKYGANPNEELTLYKPRATWITVWALFLQHLYELKLSRNHNPPSSFEDELEATKALIEGGAAADIRPWTIVVSQQCSRSHTLTPSDIFREVFPPPDASYLDRLLRKHRPWALQRLYSLLRRTILLWFYRDIHSVMWLLNWLYPIFFNDLLGVIFPLVIIPTLAYWIWLASSVIYYIFSTVAPVLLSALILDDWMPILDTFLWCTDLHNRRTNRLRRESYLDKI